MKHHLYAFLPVFPIQLLVPKIVANSCTTGEAANRKRGEVITGAVMAEITALAVFCAGAKHLVVPIYEVSFIVDDVERVMWLVRAAQFMSRADDDP